ncbi:hypothetical protein AB0K00_21790 [Dactylosporangium sp. NPDC049525]|uniref:hypothetical protein n=1 Tax=Dactylosporangium sp. NPDC049525 TaxID=3154730 RepID=UPI00341891DB
MTEPSIEQDRSDEAATPRKLKPFRGNYVAEWFGHRLFPRVASGPAVLRTQQGRTCPFLSTMTGIERECTKPADASRGVCTINTNTPAGRRDWPVCPHRVLDRPLLADAAKRLFGHDPSADIALVPATAIGDAQERQQLHANILSGTPTVVFFHEKFGGEIDLGRGADSLSFSFDITLVELVTDGPGIKFGRYGIVEIQTADFHGSYGHATYGLLETLKTEGVDFHAEVARDPTVAGKGIETPNLSNIFKRTFYQMMFKFQIGLHGQSAGCILILPKPVWESWQAHLGRPTLDARPDGTWQLRESDPEVTESEFPPAWIYVIELVDAPDPQPNKIALWKVIATDSKSFSHYALDVAPKMMLSTGGPADRIMQTIEERTSRYWPLVERRGGHDSLF